MKFASWWTAARQGRLAIAGVALLCAFYATVLLHHAREDLHTYGDCGAEAAALMCAEHFLEKGPFNLRFMCFHALGGESLYDLRQWAYGRYPPLPDFMNYVMRAMGADSLFEYRLLPIALSLAAVIFCFLLMRGLFGNPWIALAITFAYSFNETFMKNADNLHQYPYSEAMRMLAPYCTWRFAVSRESRRRWYWYAASLLATFVGVMSSWEFFIATVLLCGGILLFFDQRLRGSDTWLRKGFYLAGLLVPYGFFSVSALVANTMKNGWYYGSAGDAVAEMVKSFFYRFGSSVKAEDGSDISITFPRVWKHIYEQTRGRLGYDWPEYGAMLGLFIYAIVRAMQGNQLARRLVFFGPIIALGCVSYLLLLKQWAFIHYGLAGVRHGLPALGIFGVGLLVFVLFDFAKAIVELRTAFSRKAVVVAILAAVVLIPSWKIVHAVKFNVKEARQLWAKSHENSWATTFAEIDSLMSDVPRGAIVIGNVFWEPELRWRAGRRTEIYETFSGMTTITPEFFDKKNPYFYLFFERWGPFHPRVPGFDPNQGALVEKSREFKEWLDKEAKLVKKLGQWNLYLIDTGVVRAMHDRHIKQSGK